MLLREVPRETCNEGKGKQNYAQKRGYKQVGKKGLLGRRKCKIYENITK